MKSTPRVRAFAVALVAVALILAAVGVYAARAQDAPTVGTYASPHPGSVNTHWIESESGVVVVDAQRTLPNAPPSQRFKRPASPSRRSS